MLEYRNVVINNLPLLLHLPDTGKDMAKVMVTNNMSAMIRDSKTNEDLRICSETLSQCKEFAQKNNLKGLYKVCITWQQDLNKKCGIVNNQSTQKSDAPTLKSDANSLQQEMLEFKKRTLAAKELANKNRNIGLLEYRNTVTNNLPLLLNSHAKNSATIMVTRYMSTMIRDSKTNEDLRICSETLSQCKEFAQKNKLMELYKKCIAWQQDLNKKFGIDNNLSTQKNDENVIQQIKQTLIQTEAEINKVGMTNPDDLAITLNKLQQLEDSIMTTGEQYLSVQNIQIFLEEISTQRKQATQRNDAESIQQIKRYLTQTNEAINQTGMINLDDFNITLNKLQQLEDSIMTTGKKYLTAEYIKMFLDEIERQRQQIRVNKIEIENIFDSSGFSL